MTDKLTPKAYAFRYITVLEPLTLLTDMHGDTIGLQPGNVLEHKHPFVTSAKLAGHSIMMVTDDKFITYTCLVSSYTFINATPADRRKFLELIDHARHKKAALLETEQFAQTYKAET